jgi:GTPase
MLRSPEIGLKPFMVRSKKDIDTVKNKISNLLLTAVVPISCVTGEGLDIMHKLLAALPQRLLRSKVSQKSKQKAGASLIANRFSSVMPFVN